MANFPKNTGVFLPTTEIIDTQFIYDNPDLHQDIKEILIRIVQAFNDSNTAVNLKDTAIYSLSEILNGQLFFPNPALSSTTAQTPIDRSVFRTVIDFGALPNMANKAVAHNINVTTATTFTRIYGAATDTTGLVGIPVPQTIITGGGNIDLRIDNANVNIETTFNATNYDSCYVIIEYIKQ